MNDYTKILIEELIPAFGCTEPIALAFAAAKATQVLSHIPTKIICSCSGNIIKNAKSVVVPGTGGLKGIEISVVLGAIAGDSNKQLEVLTSIDKDKALEAKKLTDEGICKVKLVPNVENLFIKIESFYEEDSASVTLKDGHLNIVEILKNNNLIYKKGESTELEEENIINNFESIYNYANTVNIEDVKYLLDRQIEYNLNIAKEGLENDYGVKVGKTIFANQSNDINELAKAYAAAGSDARMSGCELPVVINSGSGNQGITVSLPIIVYAKHLSSSQEELYRALILGNLIAIYLKKGIGKLSAYCGVTCASAASAAGIAYLYKESLEVIEATVSNSLATISGMVCDGAKASCASKIAIALDSAFLGFSLAKGDNNFKGGDGLVKCDIDSTIKSFSRMAKEGMKETDIEILNIMLECK
jgi:L-cysteine desulfidase